MNFIDKGVISQLYQNAEYDPRKRSHYLMHKSHQDKVQRLLIGFVEGSYVEPHYHEKTNQWEMFCVLEGVFQLIKYDFDGKEIFSIDIGCNLDVKMVEILPNEIHSLKCLSPKGLLLEIKEGPFEPIDAKKYIF